MVLLHFLLGCVDRSFNLLLEATLWSGQHAFEGSNSVVGVLGDLVGD